MVLRLLHHITHQHESHSKTRHFRRRPGNPLDWHPMGLAAVLCEDDDGHTQPHGSNEKVNPSFLQPGDNGELFNQHLAQSLMDCWAVCGIC